MDEIEVLNGYVFRFRQIDAYQVEVCGYVISKKPTMWTTPLQATAEAIEERRAGLWKLFQMNPRDYEISSQQPVEYYDSRYGNIPGICAAVSRLDQGKITIAEVKKMTEKYGDFLRDIPPIDLL